MKLSQAPILAAWLLVGSGVSSAGGDGHEDLTVILMERGRAKDTAGLEKLYEQASTSPENRYAYHLARFIADPDGYASTFIQEFPDGSGAVMGYVYGLELAKDKDGRPLTPHFLYAFDQLGNLAIGGNSAAAGKLYQVAMHSDAVVTEFVCERVARVVTEQTSTALRELAKIAPDQRKRVYSCFGAASAAELSSMKSSLEKRISGSDGTLAQEMISALEAAY